MKPVMIKLPSAEEAKQNIKDLTTLSDYALKQAAADNRTPVASLLITCCVGEKDALLHFHSRGFTTEMVDMTIKLLLSARNNPNWDTKEPLLILLPEAH